ncbi:uncharacterized protein LOC132639260 [Lycium barbarum]|uniref:uncharacterized protein LOC132639260 n=1 Tax=Lycium barbarum TaxID=112863 RepID=UPI00293EBDC6|nr:uncharacterized protein LOC132639260 [Lycium barbarum]
METPKQASWIMRKTFDARKMLITGLEDLNSHEVQEKFKISKAYRALQPTWPKVHWKKLVLLKGLVPKHQFILWLAIQRKLATVDRLKKWGIQVEKNCVLCETDVEENLDHLFFQCSYSQFIRKTLMTWIGINRQIGTWESEITWLAQRTTGRNSTCIVLGIVFAAVVDHIW